MTRFSFGVQFAGPMTTDEWLAGVTRAEALGYDIATHADHLGPMHAPIPLLAAAATVTSTIRLGPLVFASDFYHPVQLGRDIVTLDHLSQGRLEVGLGIGSDGRAREYEALGLPLGSVTQRLARLAESLTVVRSLVRDGGVAFTGEYYTVPELRGVLTAVRSDGPPLLIGGASPRVLRAAGQLADVASISVPTPGGAIAVGRMTWQAVADCRGWIREGAAGRRFGPRLHFLAGGAGPAVVTDARRGQLQRHFDDLRGGPYPVSIPLGFGIEHFADSPFVLVGSVASIGEKLERLAEDYGITYVTVEASSLDSFAPVVAAYA